MNSVLHWWNARKEARRQRVIATNNCLDLMSLEVDREQRHYTNLMNERQLSDEEQEFYDGNERARIAQHCFRQNVPAQPILLLTSAMRYQPDPVQQSKAA